MLVSAYDRIDRTGRAPDHVSTFEGYDPREHLMWLMKRVFHNGHRLVDEAVRGYGVTAAQVGVLNRLNAEPGLSGAELGRRLLITPQAAQLTLTTLERQGLVERKPDVNHGRIVRTFLTEKGRHAIDSAMPVALAAEEEVFAILEPDEQKILTDLLQRLMPPVSPAANGTDGLDGTP